MQALPVNAEQNSPGSLDRPIDLPFTSCHKSCAKNENGYTHSSDTPKPVLAGTGPARDGPDFY